MEQCLGENILYREQFGAIPIGRWFGAVGFYFSNNFEKKFEHEKLKNSVSYLCTPLTTKGEVARETFYAALFEVYGAQMLSARPAQLFGDDANAARDVLLANYEKYLKGNEVFQVNVEQTEAVQTTEKEKQVFPLHGLVALFLFLIIYVEYGRRFDAGSGKPYLAIFWIYQKQQLIL